MLRRHAQVIVRIRRVMVRSSTPMRNPRPIARKQYWLECGHHATRRHNRFNLFHSPHVNVRLAIRDDVQRFFVQFVPQAHAQSLGSPLRCVGVPQPCLFFRGRSRNTQIPREMRHLHIDLIEQLALRQRMTCRPTPRSQVLQPLHRLLQRVHERPAHQYQRKPCDQDCLQQCRQHRIAQRSQHPQINIARVVNHKQ